MGRVSLRPRSNRTAANNVTPWYCCDCGRKLYGQPRVILVDVHGDEEAKIVNAKSKVKVRRWFCDYYCVTSFLTRVTTKSVLPPRSS